MVGTPMPPTLSAAIIVRYSPYWPAMKRYSPTTASVNSHVHTSQRRGTPALVDSPILRRQAGR